MAHILLVEDDTAILDLLTDFLEVEGHQIYRATSASEGRAWLAAETIHLMIADCLMAGERGDELATEVSTDIPVILLTGDLARAEALEAGGILVLRKPFSLSELKQIVDDLLPRARL